MKPKKILACFMAVCILITVVPVTARAADGETIQVIYDSSKSPKENGTVLFNTVMEAPNGSVINVAAGKYNLDDNTSRIIDKSVTIIGEGSDEAGTIIESDKYGLVLQQENTADRVTMTIKNMKITSKHDWGHPIYAKNNIDLYLENLILSNPGSTAILLDSTNKIKDSYINDVKPVVKAKNVTIDPGDYVELNANPCINTTLEHTTYADFSFEDCTNIVKEKCVPQNPTVKGYGNLFVNDNSISPTVAQINNGDKVKKYDTLQAAITVAEGMTGDVVIDVMSNVTEETVLITQKEGLNLTINGNNNTFEGSLWVYGEGRKPDVETQKNLETLVIKNFNFVANVKTKDCICVPTPSEISAKGYSTTSSQYNYAHNVTVQNSTFAAADGNTNSVVAIRVQTGGGKLAYDWHLVNCTATAIFSPFQARSMDGLKVDSCTALNCDEGINLFESNNITIKNSTIKADAYAIRTGASGSGDSAVKLTLENNILAAKAPIVLRASAPNVTLTMKGNKVTATDDLAEEAVYINMSGIQNTETVIISDQGDNTWSGVEPAAKVNGRSYKTLAEAMAVASVGNEIEILKAINDASLNDATIDLPAGGKLLVGENSTYTLPAGSSVTKNDTVTVLPYGGTIAIDGTVAVTPAPSTGGGHSPTPKYSISIATDEIENGTITANITKAKKGSTVTLIATPDSGYVLDQLIVLDKDDQQVQLTEIGDGKFTFKMPRGGVDIKASFEKKGLAFDQYVSDYADCKTDVACPMHGYHDVNQESWYHNGVHFCLDNDLMVGYGEGEFRPNSILSRSMITSMLWKLAENPVAAGDIAFDDVAADKWYEPSIRWAASMGIVSGYTNGDFGPDDALTREQMVTVLWNFAKKMGYDVSVGEETNILSYDDVAQVADYAIPAFQWACGAGLVSGKPNADNTGFVLDPTGSGTRAQIATIMMNFIEYYK